MKKRLFLVGTIVTALLTLSACASAPKQVSVNVSWDDFKKEQHISKEVKVLVDGSLTIALYSCPAEGRRWSESAQISEQTILQQTDHKLVMPKSEPPPPPGTPGQEVWTFKALRKGESTISMEYTHPWEGGEEEAMLTFALTVVVK